MNDKIIDFIKQHPRLVAAQDFEVLIQENKVQGVKFFQGKEGLKTRDLSYWVYLKVFHRNKPGFAVSTIVSEESLNRLVEAALQSAEQSQPDPWFRFPILSNRKAEDVPSMSPPDDFWKSSQDLIAPFNGTFREEYEWHEVKTSLFRRSERIFRTFTHATGKQTWSLGGLQESFWGLENRSARLLRLKGSVELLEKCSDWNGPLPNLISIGPRAMEPILQKVGAWFLADNVRKQKSPIKPDEKETLIMSECLSIVDDGLCSESPFYGWFDLEGMNPQRTTLVQNGRMKNLLYDVYNGGVDHRRSTGNSNREVQDFEPRLRSLCVQMESGAEQPEVVWQQAEEVLHLEGWLQIEFPSFRKIEAVGFGWVLGKNSEKRPVRIRGIEWDLPELFQKAFRVSSDLSSFGFTKAPTTFFRGNT